MLAHLITIQDGIATKNVHLVAPSAPVAWATSAILHRIQRIANWKLTSTQYRSKQHLELTAFIAFGDFRALFELILRIEARTRNNAITCQTDMAVPTTNGASAFCMEVMRWRNPVSWDILPEPIDSNTQVGMLVSVSVRHLSCALQSRATTLEGIWTQPRMITMQGMPVRDRLRLRRGQADRTCTIPCRADCHLHTCQAASGAY